MTQMENSPESGNDRSASDARVERRRWRRLPVVLRTPSIVLALSVLLIGAAIVLSNEMATREQSETMRHSTALHVVHQPAGGFTD